MRESAQQKTVEIRTEFSAPVCVPRAAVGCCRGVAPHDRDTMVYVEREEPGGTSTAFRINSAVSR